MSETLIASLQKRIEELTNETASLKAENKDRRLKNKKATEALEQLKAERDSLATERDAIKVRVEAAPSLLQSRIDELQGSIRTRDHRDAFGSVKEFSITGTDGKPARYKLNAGVSIEDVWRLTGYTPEGETPEGEVVSEQFGKALQARPYLFTQATEPAAGAATRPITLASREAGPGGGKVSHSPTVLAANAGRALSAPGRTPGRI